jgi:acyl dehydratase
MWVKAPELAIDWVRLLHTAHAARFHRPLPRTATVTGTARIRSLHDRGAEKGAVCVVERRIADAGTGDLYCTVEQTLLLRGNGGFGGEPPPRAERARPSERAPDMTATIAISPRAALVYRLSGDLNPLHADPEVARTAGFERPILHGLAAYGIAGAQIVRRFCGDDPARLKSLSMRFAGIALPGSAVEFSAWIQGPHIFFEARSEGRTILDQGIAEIAET